MSRDKIIEKQFSDFCDTRQSYSQLKQDLAALFFLGEGPGYFVEFGACDGVLLSNTFLLESYYKWDGILAEPVKYFHEVLKEKRKCSIETMCVSNLTGREVDFTEVKGIYCISGINEYANDEFWDPDRKKYGETYKVNTISLKDLLKKHGAPSLVDYLSIDTEGSEYSILKAYDFSTKFNFITIECPSDPQKVMLDELLENNGYVKVLESLSEFDRWYVSKNIYEGIYNGSMD